MSSARWTVTGVVCVLLLAALWIGWGFSSPGQRVATARRELVGSWVVTELSGELPEQVMPPDGDVTRVDFEDSMGDLRVRVFIVADVGEYQVGTWSLVPVLGEAMAWEAEHFRIVLRSSDEIELTETPVDGATTAPPWHARGTRRAP